MKQRIYFNQIIQGSSLRFVSNYLDSTCSLPNALRLRPVSGIHPGSEVVYHMLEKLNEQSNIQMRLSQIVKVRSNGKKYDAKMCLCLEVYRDAVHSLCCGTKITKMVLIFLQEAIK